MDRTRVQLRLLDEDVAVQDYVFPEIQGAAQIIQPEVGTHIISSTDTKRERTHDVVARFKCNGPSITLEPFATVSVDAPTTRLATKDKDASAVRIQASEQHKQQLIYLRPQDTINFWDQRLKVEVAFVEVAFVEDISAEPASRVADPSEIDNHDGDTVQVKSSNAEPEDTDRVVDRGSDDEDDITLVPEVDDEAFNAIDTTPIKARSGEVAIKETPKHENDSLDDDDAPLYSTAPNQAPESHDPLSDTEDTLGDREMTAAESPLANRRITRSHHSASETTSRSQTPSEVQYPNGTLPPRASNLTQDDDFSPSKKVAITYGKRRRTGTPRPAKQKKTPAAQEKLPETSAHSPQDVQDIDMTDQNNDAEEANALTSEIDNPRGLAIEAATRTMPNKSGKRKLSEQEDPLEEEVMLPTKKQRTDKRSSSNPSTEIDDEEMQLYEAPESDEERTKSSKPKRSTRKSTSKGRSTQESGSDIVVAARKATPLRTTKRRRASPKVIIHEERKDDTPMTDETPQEDEAPSNSAASSNLIDAIPKILLSTESAAKVSAATKKWLKKIGATVIDKVPSRRSYFVCVVPKDHSLKSAKPLHTLVMDQLVVTDDWLKTGAELRSPREYIHKALEKTVEVPRSELFSGKHLFFTENLVKDYKHGWQDIEEVAKAAGADEVDRVPFHRPVFLCNRKDVIFFGNQKSDAEASRLMKEFGCTVYSKDLFTDSIISGSLEGKDGHGLTVGGIGKKGRLS